MRFTNVTGLPAGWTMGFQRDGRERLVVMVKATYSMPAAGEAPEPAAEHVPLVEADRFTAEPGISAPLYETDYAHRKPACDVLMIGSAYAPPGRAATRIEVGLKVGPVVRQFAVIGPRVWRKDITGVSASEPEPFESLAISYDCAYGGTDRTYEDRGRTETFPANPVGKGYWRYTDRIDGQPLPNTEEINRPVQRHDVNYIPMALSPIGRNWSPRAKFAGTYNQAWIENTAPLWPDDFEERYFQAAPPDQTMPYPQGGEEIVLRNLTPDGYRAFHLPAKRMPVTFIPHKGRDTNQEGVLDTIVLEPDHERFTLTWRVTLPLAQSVFDVKETVLGEMSRAWQRARQFPGKQYYPNLDALVRARKASRGS